MQKYLWLVFLLILVYLLVKNRGQTSMAINALSSANVKTIQALQGNLGH